MVNGGLQDRQFIGRDPFPTREACIARAADLALDALHQDGAVGVTLACIQPPPETEQDRNARGEFST